MTHASIPKLDDGDPFPELTLSLVDGGTMQIPSGLNDRWCVFLLYRAYW